MQNGKVPGSSDIQCYCPATGASLGRIAPATEADIDEAVMRAKEAQVEWAKTTFAQRRKVLRTMLKCVSSWAPTRHPLGLSQLYGQGK